MSNSVSLLQPLEALGYYNQEIFEKIYNVYANKYGAFNGQNFDYCIINENPIVIMLKVEEPSQKLEYLNNEKFDRSSVEYCISCGIEDRNRGPRVMYNIAVIYHDAHSVINIIEESLQKENKKLSIEFTHSVKEMYIKLAGEDNLIFDFKRKYQALKDYWILNNQELFLNIAENDLEKKKDIVSYCGDRYSPFIYKQQLIIRDYSSAKFFLLDDSEGVLKVYGEDSSYGLDSEIELDEEFDWDLNCDGERWSFLFLKHIKQEKNLVALELDNNEVYFVNRIYEHCEGIVNFLYEELIHKEVSSKNEEFEIQIEVEIEKY